MNQKDLNALTQNFQTIRRFDKSRPISSNSVSYTIQKRIDSDGVIYYIFMAFCGLEPYHKESWMRTISQLLSCLERNVDKEVFA